MTKPHKPVSASGKKAVSVQGLDDFSRKFLFANQTPKADEYVTVIGKQTITPEALKKYERERIEDFIKRAGSFTEDLVGFIVQQKRLRELSDMETVFGIALACINLRALYGSPQGGEKVLSAEQKEKLLEEFDEICFGAQQYYDAHKQS